MDAREEYLNLLSEIHKIECEHMNKAGIQYIDTSYYKFRGEAFQQLLKNPVRKILAQHEDLCAKLAVLVDNFDEAQKNKYENDVQIEYQKKCK